MTNYLFHSAFALVLAGSVLAAMTARQPVLAAPPSDASRYHGMWVTADGHIRQELLPNGRYDEARGTRASAYQGRYEIQGNRIAYWDDTGFTADGTFVNLNELHHGGMVFYRRK